MSSMSYLMEKYNDLGKLETYFHLKEAKPFFLFEWCKDHNLISGECICPVCKETMVLAPCSDLPDKLNWSCHIMSNRKLHHVKRNIRKGSWFDESTLPIPKILLLTFMWVGKLPIDFITEQLVLYRSMVEHWGMLCRILCLKALVLCSRKVGGKDTVVEIYKNQLRKYKYKNKKLLKGKWVIWGYQRGTCECFFSIVKEDDQESLFNVLQKYVLPEATVISTNWKACGGTKILKYFCQEANHNLKFKEICPVTDRKGEKLFFGYKKFLRSLERSGVINDNFPEDNPVSMIGEFDFYLAEYVWRKKYKKSVDRMDSLLEAVTRLYPTRKAATDQMPEVRVKMEFDVGEISEEMTIETQPDTGEQFPEGMAVEIKPEPSETISHVEEQSPERTRIKVDFAINDEMTIIPDTETQLEKLMPQETETHVEEQMPHAVTIKIEPEE